MTHAGKRHNILRPKDLQANFGAPSVIYSPFSRTPLFRQVGEGVVKTSQTTRPCQIKIPRLPHRLPRRAPRLPPHSSSIILKRALLKRSLFDHPQENFTLEGRVPRCGMLYVSYFECLRLLRLLRRSYT